MVIADSNFRVGSGFAKWDPGGGVRCYAISFVFNGAAFCSSWVDLGVAFSANGYTVAATHDFTAGADTLQTSIVSGGVLTAGNACAATPGMDNATAAVWSGRGGTGFGVNRFTGLLGALGAKASAAFPTGAMDLATGWPAYFGN